MSTHPRAETPKNRYRWILLMALTLIMVLINIDYTAVNLALFAMSKDLHTGFNTIQWVLSSYVLTWGLLVIPAGNYIDNHSKRTMCILGLSIFLLGSAVAVIANSAGLLIAGRMIQGIAAAIYVPTIYALIYLNFPEHERGRAIGIMSLGVGLGLSIGPFLGGVLLEYFNWRSIFIINIPIVLLVLGIIAKAQSSEHIVNNIQKMDKMSLVCFSLGMMILQMMLTERQFWTHLVFIIPLLFVVMIAFTACAYRQIKFPNTSVSRELFFNYPFQSCLTGIFFEQYAFSSIIVSLGIYLQLILKYSVIDSGFIFLFLTIIFGGIAACGGFIIDKIGCKIPTVLGFLLMIVGLYLFRLMSLFNLEWIHPILIIIGAGMGLAFSGLNTGIVKTLSQEQVGIGSSLFLVSALLGNSLGVAITTAILQLIPMLNKAVAEIMSANCIILFTAMILYLFLSRISKVTVLFN